MARAGKRADRATSEGLVGVIVDGGVGTIIGVGCETEPVSKNDGFQAFAEKALRAVHADGPAAADELDQERLELMGKLGENIVVVGAERYEGGTLAAYVHPPANKIGVLVQLGGGTEDLGRQLAMHISFAAPEWTTRDDVPADVVEAERQIYLNSDELLAKPEAAREKIVDGMLGKRFFAASPGGVLADQAWIHDAAKSVGTVLSEAGASVTAFTRVSVAGS
jgi:elongation factor Ts